MIFINFTVNTVLARSLPGSFAGEGDKERFPGAIQECPGPLDEKSCSVPEADIAKISAHQVFGKEPPADPFQLTGVQTTAPLFRNLPDT
jgi:hypothetical protein